MFSYTVADWLAFIVWLESEFSISRISLYFWAKLYRKYNTGQVLLNPFAKLSGQIESSLKREILEIIAD